MHKFYKTGTTQEQFLDLANKYLEIRIDDNEDNEIDLLTINKKLEQIFQIENQNYLSCLIDTLSNMIEENGKTIDEIIKRCDLLQIIHVVSSEQNHSTLSVLRFITKIFQNYDGNIENIINLDIVKYLVMNLYENNVWVLKEDLNSISSLFRRGDATNLIIGFANYDGLIKILDINIDPGIKLIFSPIFELLINFFSLASESNEIQPIVNNDLLHQVYQKIFLATQLNPDINNEMQNLLECLNYVIYFQFKNFEKNPSNLQEPLETFKNFILKSLKINNKEIVVLGIKLLTWYFFLNMSFLLDFGLLQDAFNKLIHDYGIDEDIICSIFDIYLYIADDLSMNDKISERIINQAIEYSTSENYSIKSKSVHLISALIQMQNQDKIAQYFIQNYDFIILLADFIYSDEQIAERVLNALIKIIEIIQNNVKDYPITVGQILSLLDFDYLNKLETDGSITVQSCARWLIRLNEKFSQDETG